MRFSKIGRLVKEYFGKEWKVKKITRPKDFYGLKDFEVSTPEKIILVYEGKIDSYFFEPALKRNAYCYKKTGESWQEFLKRKRKEKMKKQPWPYGEEFHENILNFMKEFEKKNKKRYMLAGTIAKAMSIDRSIALSHLEILENKGKVRSQKIWKLFN